MELKARDDVWRPKPGVINIDMIKQAVTKMLADNVPGNNIDEEEGYEFDEITHLYLEHLDILRIDHLWIMPALRVLKLTGNSITKIENLEALINLVDLNLSFNSITKIENLEKLTKLRHLSLFSNLITKIENLDNLTNLKILTIGENKIDDKSCILHLRNLQIFSLNLANNPCAQTEGFRQFVAAYLPLLDYYEYHKITAEDREVGRTAYLVDLEVLEREEAEAAKEAMKAEAQADKEELYFQAFVEGLDEDQLYDLMFNNDPSGQALLLIGNEVDEIFNRFKTEISNATTEIFNLGLTQLQLRNREVEIFQQGTRDAIVQNRTKQRQTIEKFFEFKANMFVDINNLWGVLSKERSDENVKKSFEQKVDSANILCTSTKRELLNLELTLSEQLKEVFSLFERSLGDMVNLFIETAQGHFTTMRECETVFSEQLGDQASRFLNQLTIRNEDVSSLPPPLRLIMVDKEAVNSAVANSHDIHLQAIDTREDQLMSRIRSWYHKLCSDTEQEEIARFRGRISEIRSFLEIQSVEFQQYHINLDDDVFVLGESI